MRRKLERKLTRVRKAVKGIVEESQVELKSKLNSPILYLLGIIAGGGVAHDFSQRIITIRYHRRAMNRGTKDEGIICAPGISQIRIRQVEAIKRDVESIMDKLTSLFGKTEPKNSIRVVQRSPYDHDIIIQFSKDSKFWKTIYDYIQQSERKGRRLIPKIPEKILSGKPKHLALAFLRGYADIRCRISAKDREGLNGPLRIALSVSMKAKQFAKQLRQLMKTTLGIKRIQILEGGRRGRETMIRFDPVELPKNFFTLHWRRLLLNDFSNYNLENYPNRYN